APVPLTDRGLLVFPLSPAYRNEPHCRPVPGWLYVTSCGSGLSPVTTEQFPIAQPPRIGCRRQPQLPFIQIRTEQSVLGARSSFRIVSHNGRVQPIRQNVRLIFSGRLRA